METKKSHRGLLCLGFAFMLGWFPGDAGAQTVVRQCVSSYGNSGSAGNVVLSQTAGQSYSTSAVDSKKATALPGFQQSVIFSVQEMVPEIAVDLQMDVYPNPAAYTLNLQTREPMEEVFIQVVDLQGSVVETSHLFDFTSHKLDCAMWPNGTYFITVKDKKNNSKTFKLIISK